MAQKDIEEAVALGLGMDLVPTLMRIMKKECDAVLQDNVDVSNTTIHHLQYVCVQ